MTEIRLPRDQLMQAMKPYVRREIAAGSAEAQAIVRSARRSILHGTGKTMLKRVTTGKRPRNSAEVEEKYTQSYADGVAAIDAGLAPRRYNNFRLDDGTIVNMPALGLFSAYAAALEKAVRALQPGSVCEIGFGTGRYLLYLAARFPEIAFSGFELTPSGVEVARSLQRLDVLPPNLNGLVQAEPHHAERFRAIDYQQGNAAALPAKDKSVDMIYTVLALEQMADILPQALSEIRRVARRYAVFIEPFREANDLYGRLHLRVGNYFRSSQAEFERAGFRPVTMVMLPNKLTYGASMLVAEVT